MKMLLRPVFFCGTYHMSSELVRDLQTGLTSSIHNVEFGAFEGEGGFGGCGSVSV